MGQPARIRRIVVEFIPHREQRYDTAGDWFFRDAAHDEMDHQPAGTGAAMLERDCVLQIAVSTTQDQRHEQLVAVHELIEALLCYHAGVSAEAVDQFDMRGDGALLDEPGDDPRAPYASQHNAATGHERLLSHALGVTWASYEAAIDQASCSDFEPGIDPPEPPEAPTDG